MKIFKLPDLGEGLPDAIIREWYVKAGEEVTIDQPIVAMETAKALVDVPAPFAGKIEKLYGKVGDTIETGHPLIGFEGDGDTMDVEEQDSGTVVGAIQTSDEMIGSSATGVAGKKPRAIPAVRMLAKNLGVDLATIKPKGARITTEEVMAAAGTTPKQAAIPAMPPLENATQLSSAKRGMVLSMQHSHQHVVPASISDDADITAWKGKRDVTLTILRAMAKACDEEPMVNSYFDGDNMAYRLNDSVNIGIAVDTKHGLYVPVITDIDNKTDKELREIINQYKEQAQSHSIKQEDLKGATIMMSNFGTFAGRYANPIIVPPMVATIAIGRSRDQAVAVDGKVEIHHIMPLSITFDHRAVTGGEAARFLKIMMNALQNPDA